jgi:hypothetical protein
VSALQNQQLLPQAEILGDQSHPRPKSGRNRPDQKANHPCPRLMSVIEGGQTLRLSTAKPMDSHFAPHRPRSQEIMSATGHGPNGLRARYQTLYKVSNFQVQPGDLVSVLVCSPQPGQGFVSMLNHRTQQATSVGVPRPGSDITSVGARAEWIVEGISANLPDFSSVIFTDAMAGTQHHSFNLYPGGIITNITGSSGNALTQALIGTPSAAAVLWEGSA